jgi:hypothetical protein
MMSIDLSLVQYFERIEASFCRHRGAPLLLSPLDFERAVEWFAASIPVDVVEEGVADYFARLASRKVPLRRAICLSFAEDLILKALAARRAAAVGRAAGVHEREPQSVRVARFLEDRAIRLDAFCGDPRRSSAMPMTAGLCEESAGELRALIPKSGLSTTTLEGRLQPLDRELCRLVMFESPRDLSGSWREEALERLGDLAQSMEGSALRQTVEKLACQSAFSHWRLARLSLLFMEDEI